MVICYAVQSMGVAVEVLVLGEGREAAVHEALSAAERNSSWVIIDKLHLGTPKFLRDLRLQLHRIHKARGEWMSWREKNYFLHILEACFECFFSGSIFCRVYTLVT